MFDKAKDLYKIQKQARDIKAKLKKTHIEAETDGVTVTVNGEQEVQKIDISEEALQKAQTNKKGLEEALEKSFNKAIKKSQQIGAEMMKEVMGGFPGLGGGEEQ